MDLRAVCLVRAIVFDDGWMRMGNVLMKDGCRGVDGDVFCGCVMMRGKRISRESGGGKV